MSTTSHPERGQENAAPRARDEEVTANYRNVGSRGAAAIVYRIQVIPTALARRYVRALSWISRRALACGSLQPRSMSTTDSAVDNDGTTRNSTDSRQTAEAYQIRGEELLIANEETDADEWISAREPVEVRQ